MVTESNDKSGSNSAARIHLESEEKYNEKAAAKLKTAVGVAIKGSLAMNMMKQVEPDFTEVELQQSEKLIESREIAGRQYSNPIPLEIARLLPEFKFLHWHVEETYPTRYLIIAPAGIGKTSTVVDHIKQELSNGTVWYLLPTIKMCEQVAESFATAGLDNIVVFRGRNQEGMCERYNLANYVASTGLSVQKSICRSGTSLCPYYGSCAYQEQLRSLNPDAAGDEADEEEELKTRVFLLAHQFLSFPTAIPNPDLVIVDETYWQSLIQEIDFHPDTLFIRPKQDSIAGRKYIALVEEIVTAFRANPNNLLRAVREMVHDPKKRVEQAVTYLQSEYAQLTSGLDCKPEDDDSIIQSCVARRQIKEIKIARMFFEALLLEIDLPRNIAHGLVYDPRSKQNVNGRPETQARISVYRRVPIFIDAATPIIVLDASADESITKSILSKDIQIEVITARRNAQIFQVRLKVFSRQSITGKDRHGKRIESRINEARRLQDQIIDFVSALTGKVLLVATKQVEELLLPSLPDNVVTSHFSALRGRGDFEDCDTAVIVGREQPSAEAIEKYARAVYAKDPKPLLLTGAYAKKTRWRRMANGTSEQEEAWVHPDPRVQGLLEQIREQEIEQAMDRLRLIHNMEPKTIYLLNNIVLDVPIDTSLRWSELRQGGSKIQRALERVEKSRFAFPLSATELARLHPDLWSTANAAKSYLREHGGNKWVKTQINIYLENDPLISVEYRRPGQRGRPSKALVRADLEDPRSALEAVVGPFQSMRLCASSPEPPQT